MTKVYWFTKPKARGISQTLNYLSGCPPTVRTSLHFLVVVPHPAESKISWDLAASSSPPDPLRPAPARGGSSGDCARAGQVKSGRPDCFLDAIPSQLVSRCFFGTENAQWSSSRPTPFWNVPGCSNLWHELVPKTQLSPT